MRTEHKEKRAGKKQRHPYGGWGQDQGTPTGLGTHYTGGEIGGDLGRGGGGRGGGGGGLIGKSQKGGGGGGRGCGGSWG